MFVAGSKADRREPYRQQICRSRACATNPGAVLDLCAVLVRQAGGLHDFGAQCRRGLEAAP